MGKYLQGKQRFAYLAWPVVLQDTAEPSIYDVIFVYRAGESNKIWGVADPRWGKIAYHPKSQVWPAKNGYSHCGTFYRTLKILKNK